MEPIKRTANHDRNYTIILAVAAGLTAMAAISSTSIMNRPGIDERGRWVFAMARNMECFFVVLSLAVLATRIWFSAKRKWVTLVFNILLLFFFPFGTVFGIYGLWKVDKNAPN